MKAKPPHRKSRALTTRRGRAGDRSACVWPHPVVGDEHGEVFLRDQSLGDLHPVELALQLVDRVVVEPLVREGNQPRPTGGEDLDLEDHARAEGAHAYGRRRVDLHAQVTSEAFGLLEGRRIGHASSAGEKTYTVVPGEAIVGKPEGAGNFHVR